MVKLLLIGTGGFAGAILRYAAAGAVMNMLDRPVFPYGTLAVNVLGCLLIGLLAGVAESRQFLSPEVRMLVFIGFLGGFTTFSTFGYEVFQFTRDGQVFSACLNVGLHLVLGLGGVFAGAMASRLM
jgi:CrcB protein